MGTVGLIIKMICYLSLMYGNLELGRLILQYIRMTYGIAMVPPFLINLRPPDPTATVFFLEFGFVMIGVTFLLGLAAKQFIDRFVEHAIHGRCDRCVLRFHKVERSNEV